MSIKALYIHVPFCAHICAYCDFMRVGYHPKLVQDYISALALEIKGYDLSSVDTVYFGGGTPSCLSINELKQLFDLVQVVINQAQEITFEINPETLTKEKVQLLKERGINRISLGVQSFHHNELIEMDRKHTVTDITQAIEWLRDVGLTNISVDLMYGLPLQTIESLKASLKQVFDYNLDHFSIYALTIEENSTWGRQKREKIDEDLEADMYELICSEAKKQGYRHYEISNFTKDKPSLHNLHYWNYDDYVGLGPGAHSKLDFQRLENTRNFQDYIKNPKQKREIELSHKDQVFEHLMMGLRVDTGIDIVGFNQKTGAVLLKDFNEVIQKHLHLDHLRLENGNLKATEKGRELLHEILVDFLAD